MSSTNCFKRPKKPRRARILTHEKLEDWLATREHPMPGVSMIDGYLARSSYRPSSFLPKTGCAP